MACGVALKRSMVDLDMLHSPERTAIKRRRTTNAGHYSPYQPSAASSTEKSPSIFDSVTSTISSSEYSFWPFFRFSVKFLTFYSRNSILLAIGNSFVASSTHFASSSTSTKRWRSSNRRSRIAFVLFQFWFGQRTTYGNGRHQRRFSLGFKRRRWYVWKQSVHFHLAAGSKIYRSF